MIHSKKFPFTDFKESTMFREALQKSNATNPNLPSQFINMNYRIWGSNPGWSNTNIFSPKHPGQLLHPPSLQPNEHQGYFFGHKVARAESLTTHIHRQPSLSSSGAKPLLNISASMAHIGTTSLYLDLIPMYI